jgi:hypothetical protein
MAGKRLFSATGEIHFTEGRFQPALHTSAQRTAAWPLGAALNSFDFTSDYYEPTGSNVHLEGDLRLTGFQSIS